jgi:hypothetical protein
MTSLNPLPAAKALDTYFLDARCKILEVAAILDRINRGRDAVTVENDPRMTRVHQAIEVLLDRNGERAERIQQVFSLQYDPHWEKPKPR